MFVKKYGIRVLAITLTLAALTACAKGTPTVDPVARITELAATVQAQITEMALLTPSATATLTPTETGTPTLTLAATTPAPATPTRNPFFATTVGDNSKWVEDITIPDYSQVAPSSTFVKTWRIQNTGSTTWTTDYKLIYLDGMQDASGALSVKLTKSVAPGDTVDISVTFTAPASNGLYTSYWKMYTATGYLFGDPFYMYVNVGTGTLTPTTAVTGTITPTSATSTPTPTASTTP